MSRYINASLLLDNDKLCEGVSCQECHFYQERPFECEVDNYIRIALMEDSLDIVFCKGCKYWKPWNNGNGECNLHGEDIDFDIEVSPTDYCSFGRRRDE